MAEEQNPVTHSELVEIVRRLDDRISTMDRHIDDRFEAVNARFETVNAQFETVNARIEAVDDRISTLDRNVNQNLTEMRSDIRMLTRAMIGFYAFIIAAVGIGFTLYRLFPNPTP
ncbi:MAG: hypothetical protein ETSY1_37455 [Candidatus Entotheonella factor]|uniref:t-SNARE coiled-coil homology domain-containing protein n=1 Tax=Entotheonella factor TaxID=1429438 RepID=W4L6Z5_ENTF1|nr:MAG: hypothetical protein ETSY1_37455 [Candidatus Entotheonella factor]